MNERGGYRCSFKGCQSASSEKRGIKETLFRFPKDIERSKLWVSACDRKELFSKTAVQLYNGYRVCKLHFANNMFLNYERTRLQPHAVPNYIVRNNDEEASSNSSSVETHCVNLKIENIQKGNAENIEVNAEGKDIVLDITTFNKRDLDKTRAKMSESGTQTPLSLSSTSPRKVHLFQQIRAYKKKIVNLELELQKKNYKAKRTKMKDIHTLDMLLEKYFPKQTFEFLKMQARLFEKDSKDRRYDNASFK